MVALLNCLPKNLITFERHEDGARSSLKVSNPSSHHIAMKMKTNSADRYNVKPHFCLLAPNSTRVISISVLKNHLQSVVDEARASSIEGEKKKIVFILFEWLVPPEVLSQVSEPGTGDGEVSSSLKSIWAAYEKDPETSGAFLKHRFPIAVVDAAPVNTTESGSDARMSVSLSSNKGGTDDTVNESFFSTGAVPATETKTLLPSDRYSSAYDSSTDTGYDTAAAQPWTNSSGTTSRPRLPPQGPQGDAPNYDNSGSSNSSAEAGAAYGLPAYSSTLPTSSGPVMTAEEARAKRADYNRIVNQTLLLQSEMQGLEHALVSRDKEADDLRSTINELRQQLILANSSANQAENTDGLRQRRKEPSAQTTSTVFTNEPPEPDDNTVKGGIDEGGGCPLYVVLVVGLIMFLIGFLIPRSTTIN